MPSLIVALVFVLTIVSIFVNRRILEYSFLKFLNIPYFISPLIGTVLLFLLGVLAPAQVFEGIFAAEISNGFALLNSSGPFSTIVLFLSISFISLSLEATGFFRYISVKILEKVSGSRKKLFTAVFWVTGLFALFTSNDIIILTLTPFLLEFLDIADINAMPFLIAEFFAANIFSMILLIGNETNIIASTVHSIGFIQHFRYMVLPGITGGIAAFSVLYFIFRNDIADEYNTSELPEVRLDREKLLTFSLLILTILSLAIFSTMGFLLWRIGLFWAVTTLVLLCIYHNLFRNSRDSLSRINDKMPWEVIPFLTGFFLLVQGFSATGLNNGMSQALCSLFGESVFSAIFGIGILSTISASLMNNIPMTVLFSDLILQFGSGEQQLAAVYSLILGSNIGANITPIGALAGIIWMKMINHEKRRINFKEFLVYGLKTTLITAAVSLSTLYLVMI